MSLGTLLLKKEEKENEDDPKWEDWDSINNPLNLDPRRMT